MASETVIPVTDAEFEEKVLKSALPVIVDFWADWCGPCRMMGPVFEEVAQAYVGQAVFVKMNVDENPATPGRYDVRSIPNLKVFKAGEMVDEIIGAVPKPKLDELVKKVL